MRTQAITTIQPMLSQTQLETQAAVVQHSFLKPTGIPLINQQRQQQLHGRNEFVLTMPGRGQHEANTP